MRSPVKYMESEIYQSLRDKEIKKAVRRINISAGIILAVIVATVLMTANY